jgi:hypothetical protein
VRELYLRPLCDDPGYHMLMAVSCVHVLAMSIIHCQHLNKNPVSCDSTTPSAMELSVFSALVKEGLKRSGGKTEFMSTT